MKVDACLQKLFAAAPPLAPGHFEKARWDLLNALDRIADDERDSVTDACVALFPPTTRLSNGCEMRPSSLREILDAAWKAPKDRRVDLSKRTRSLSNTSDTRTALQAFTALCAVHAEDLDEVCDLTRRIAGDQPYVGSLIDTLASMAHRTRIGAAASLLQMQRETSPISAAELLKYLARVPETERAQFVRDAQRLFGNSPRLTLGTPLAMARELSAMTAEQRAVAMATYDILGPRLATAAVLRTLGELHKTRAITLAKALVQLSPPRFTARQGDLVEALVNVGRARWDHVIRCTERLMSPHGAGQDRGDIVRALQRLRTEREREAFVALTARLGLRLYADTRAELLDNLSRVPHLRRAAVVASWQQLGMSDPKLISALGRLPAADHASVVAALAALTTKDTTNVEVRQLLHALTGMPAIGRRAIATAHRRARDAAACDAVAATAAWHALVDHMLDAGDPHGAYGHVPLRLFFPYKEYVGSSLRERFPATVAALTDKQFDPRNTRHCFVAYLEILQSPHAYKLLHGAPFTYDACKEALCRRHTRDVLTMPAREIAECWFLAYETSLLYDTMIAPAMERAQALGLPLRIIGNITYGGTALTALPIRALKEQGVEFIFTKQGSTEAHDDANVLNPGLFSDAQLTAMVSHPAIYVVVDGSKEGHYPAGLRAYRNMAMLINNAMEDGVDPRAFMQYGLDKRRFTAQSNQFSLKRRVEELVRDSDNRQFYQLFFATMTEEPLETIYGDNPLFTFEWSQVRGPAFVLAQVSMPDAQIADAKDIPAQRLRAQEAVRKDDHRAAYFDDSEYQTPVMYVGRYGFKVKPPLHPDTRHAYKVLRDGDQERRAAAPVRFPKGRRQRPLSPRE